MSNPLFPDCPPAGEIRYFDSIQPPFKQGMYKFELNQDIELDGGDTSVVNKKKSYFVNVDGDELFIDPMCVHSRTPAKNTMNIPVGYDMPKIVFQNKTLPWERSIKNVEDDPELPWMALLLLTEKELETYSDGGIVDTNASNLPFYNGPPCNVKTLSIDETFFKSIAPLQSEIKYLAHGLQVNPVDKELCGSDEDGLFSVVISNRIASQFETKYTAVLVSIENNFDDLPISAQYMTNPSLNAPQQINQRSIGTEFLEIAAGLNLTLSKEDSSTESSSKGVPRMVKKQKFSKSATMEGKGAAKGYTKYIEYSGTQNLNLDIEIDGPMLSYIEQSMVGELSGDYITLVVLDHWKFQTGDGGGFKETISSLNVRRHRSEEDAVGALSSLYEMAKEDDDILYEPSLLGNDMDPGVTKNSFVLTEITEYDGSKKPCFYRSPCIAIPTQHLQKDEPYANSDDAKFVDVDTKYDVIHHSAAFELGRLLALSDPRFLESLTQWRRLYGKSKKKSQVLDYIADNETKHPILHQALLNEIEGLDLDELLQRELITKIPVLEPEIIYEREVLPDGTPVELIDLGGIDAEIENTLELEMGTFLAEFEDQLKSIGLTDGGDLYRT